LFDAIGGLNAAATVLAAVSMWLMLPRGALMDGGRGVRLIGALLGVIALGLFGSQIPDVGDWLTSGLFWVLGGVTVVSAAAAMTFRNPVYCAVWFGLMLLGTAGLFFFQGAQFLGVATIVVYAGAILVTLLFVLMLANPQGHTHYDRNSWEAPLAATAGMVMVGVLTLTIGRSFTAETPQSALKQAGLREGATPGVMSEQHVAGLGATLFSNHLIAVEVAGTLLLVALVGAMAIVAHGVGRDSRPSG
jgi:NADH-quinone oxidoreductase subunit J